AGRVRGGPASAGAGGEDDEGTAPVGRGGRRDRSAWAEEGCRGAERRRAPACRGRGRGRVHLHDHSPPSRAGRGQRIVRGDGGGPPDRPGPGRPQGTTGP